MPLNVPLNATSTSLFSRLNHPSFLSYSSQGLCSTRPFTFSGCSPAPQCLSCSEWEAQHWIQNLGWDLTRVQGLSFSPFASPAGHTAADIGQDVIGLLGYLGTAGSSSAAVNQQPLVLFCWAAFQALCPQPVALLHGVLATQGQDPAPCLFEPYTTGLDPSIQSAQIPLQTLLPSAGITPTQLGVICKLSEGHSVKPSPRSLTKIINGAGPTTEPWGTLLVTGCQSPYKDRQKETISEYPSPNMKTIHQKCVKPLSSEWLLSFFSESEHENEGN